MHWAAFSVQRLAFEALALIFNDDCVRYGAINSSPLDEAIRLALNLSLQSRDCCVTGILDIKNGITVRLADISSLYSENLISQ
jgi:hypothetical protein